MVPILLLALVQAAAPPAAPPPGEWGGLPLVYLTRDSRIEPHDTLRVMRYAETQTACGRSVRRLPDRMRGIHVEIAILVGPDGALRDILTAPGPCDAVRTYARNLIARRYRGRVRPPAGNAPAWYRSSLGFSWGE